MNKLVTLFSYCFNIDGLRYEHQQNDILRHLDLETSMIYLESKKHSTIIPNTPTKIITLQHQIDIDFETRS